VRSLTPHGRLPLVIGLLLAVTFLPSCALLRGLGFPVGREHEMEVWATAYNSLPGQTDRHPDLTAFGTRLEPGMRVVAVSNDLYEMGLRQGVRLEIEGLPGEWRVADRMNSRWKKKIDLYMGTDVQAARRWGARRVKIRWREP
jgi:3D (Asp-Asp-Asp) domain-containing protein